jgi:hypothetical protein
VEDSLTSKNLNTKVRPQEYANAWRELEKVRFTILWLIVGFTFVAGVFGLFFLMGVALLAEFVVVVLVWAGFWIWSFVRYLRWPCPRCGKRWQAKAGGGFTLIPRQRCASCDLAAGS